MNLKWNTVNYYNFYFIRYHNVKHYPKNEMKVSYHVDTQIKSFCIMATDS